MCEIYLELIKEYAIERKFLTFIQSFRVKGPVQPAQLYPEVPDNNCVTD